MNLKINIPLDLYTYVNDRLWPVTIAIFLISAITYYVEFRIHDCRVSVFFATKADTEVYHYPAVCNISFDECLCPVLANRSMHSARCVDATLATTAHIAPLVSYVLHIYAIHDLFTLTGIYSGVVRHILWVLALFVFSLVAIGVYGSRCIHSCTSLVISMTGMLQFGIVVALENYVSDHYGIDELSETDEEPDRAA